MKRWAPPLLCLLVLPACVTRQDIRGIQTDIYNIQQSIESRLGGVKDQTDNVQTSQADLLQEIRDLSGNLTVLKSELNDYQQRMQVMSARLDDLEASLTARMDSQIELLSGSKFVEKPLPSTAFNLANTDFARGKYSEAITGYRSFIKQYPKSEKVSEARLKLGDALAKQKDYEGAIDSYEELLKTAPQNPNAPAAMMRKGATFETQGKKAQARESYMALLKSYPHSNEAKTAQERLRSLQSDTNKP